MSRRLLPLLLAAAVGACGEPPAAQPDEAARAEAPEPMPEQTEETRRGTGAPASATGAAGSGEVAGSARGRDATPPDLDASRGTGPALPEGEIQARIDAGERVIELGEGDYMGDIVIPDEWDGVIRGAGGWFNTRIRGDILAPGWGRYTLEGLTVTGNVRLERIYLGVVRDVVVFGEGSSFRLGTPGVNRSSAVVLDNVHVSRADSFRVYAADLLMVGGSVERGATDPLFDASADFGGIVVLGVRFEHDRRWAVRVRGPHVRVQGTTHILSDLVVESGNDVEWDGLVLVQSEVVDRRR